MQKSRKETSLLNNWTIDFFCLYEVICISKNELKEGYFDEKQLQIFLRNYHGI